MESSRYALHMIVRAYWRSHFRTNDDKSAQLAVHVATISGPPYQRQRHGRVREGAGEAKQPEEEPHQNVVRSVDVAKVSPLVGGDASDEIALRPPSRHGALDVPRVQRVVRARCSVNKRKSARCSKVTE